MWSASRYLAFGGERTRAAADLLARVPLESPARVVDLGCGPGNSTEILAARYPEADILGIDTSEDMILRAREAQKKSGMRASFSLGDVATFAPAGPVDLLFANAVLHWLPEHRLLLPRLAGYLAKGGVLAVQMPGNHVAPTHRLLFEISREAPWSSLFALPPTSVLEPIDYQRLLGPLGQVDIWETTYLHTLKGADPVLAWVRGTTLVPVREALSDEHYAAFESAYGARLRDAYPPEADGTTLLPFRRLFVILRLS